MISQFRIGITVAILLTNAILFAQQVDPSSYGYYNDALLFSSQQLGGTARNQAIGGAQMALGADVSTTILNPAGLGVYRKSEFSISPGLNFNKTTSTYTSPSDETSSNGLNLKFHIPSMGIVFNNTNDNEISGPWRSASFAITFNRIANYNQRFNYEGENNVNSYRNYFLEQAQGNFTGSQLGEMNNPLGLSYYTWLVNNYLDSNTGIPIDDNDFFTFDNGSRVLQTEKISVSGAQNVWDFAYGANYRNKLFVGGGIGINSINHQTTRKYSEKVYSGVNGILDGFTFDETIKMSGAGIHAKAGIIYRADDYVRFAASLATPTWYGITETYNSTMTSNLKNAFEYVDPATNAVKYAQGNNEASTDPNDFKFNILSPARLSGGTAFFLKKYGFISADIDYVAYNTMQLSAKDEPFRGDNNTIASIYQNTINYRLGAEARFDEFRLRGGYAYYGDPYKSSLINNSTQFVTGGIGFRFDHYGLDFALVHSTTNMGYKRYELFDRSEPYVNVKNKNTSFLVTWSVNINE